MHFVQVMPRVAVVVPCYNEAARLPVAEFERCLETTALDFVFVDDGSRDGTRAVLDGLAARYPSRVVAVGDAVNRGKAEAVRRGMSVALAGEHDYAGFWDADLATPLEAIAAFVQILNERPGVTMVFGSRVKLLGRKVERRAIRHYLGRVFATVVSVMLRLPIYDTQCGAKLFRVTPQTRSFFEHEFCTRWVFDVEIIARYIQAVGADAASQGIYEYPLNVWTDIAGSKVKPRDFLKAFLDVVRIYTRYR